MYEMFPDVPKEDIQRILKFGWKTIYLHNSYGGDTVISDSNFWCYIGTLRRNSLEHFKYYVRKLALKIRILYKRTKQTWDGNYYFALSENQYQDFLSQKNKKGRPKKFFKYGTVMLYKILDECKITEHNKKYIFKIPYGFDIGFKTLKENFESGAAELVIERDVQTFKDILISNNQYEIL